MKHTKKLIPALGMLLLSASMLVTSTFAWFSVNLNVEAKNITVSAVGDQVYLQIAAGTLDGANGTTKATFTAGEAHKDAQGTASAKGLTPVTVVDGLDDATTTITNADFSNHAYVGGDFSWVTATSDAVDQWATTGTYTKVDSTNYYHKNSFVIRLNKDAGKATADAPLKVNNIALTNTAATGDGQDFSKCVSVLVVCGEYTQLWNQKTGAWAEVEATSNGKLSAGNFADTTGVQVDVYVFFDGENENCSIADFTAAGVTATYTVSVSFTVSA